MTKSEGAPLVVNFPDNQSRISKAADNLRGFLRGDLEYEGSGSKEASFIAFWTELWVACGEDQELVDRIFNESVGAPPEAVNG